jgi:hypothetical protein
MVVDLIGEINYLSSTTDGCPPWLVEHSVATTMRSNFVQGPVSISIHDLRGKEKSVNLDTNGFEIVKYNGSIQEEFEEGSEAQKMYYEEIIDLLTKRLGASRVFIYHHAFRFRSSALADEKLDHTHRNPVFYPHVDADGVAAQQLVDEKLGKEEGEKVKKNRIQLINVWRPLGPHPITDKPLTICDYRSIDVNKDIRPLTIRGANHDYSSYALSRNADDAHQWYYLSQMRSDEMFIFKIYDSKSHVAQCGFHTAFKNGNGPTPNEEQKSLELRCFVFYDQ